MYSKDRAVRLEQTVSKLIDIRTIIYSDKIYLDMLKNSSEIMQRQFDEKRHYYLESSTRYEKYRRAEYGQKSRDDYDLMQKAKYLLDKAKNLEMDGARKLEYKKFEFNALMFSIIASSTIWSKAVFHLDELSTIWLQEVIPGRFGIVDTAKFQKSWDDFLQEICLTTVLMRERGGEFDAIALREGFDNAARSETPHIFDFIEKNAICLNIDSHSKALTNPILFELHCAAILNENMWNANITAATGDQGADVIAIKNGQKAVIQCKLYSEPVGNKAVQEVSAAMGFQRAHFAAVVSNTSYTKSARELADSLNVHLLHYSELANWALSI